MKDAIKTIVASRSLIALALVAMTVVVAGGVTFGAWTVGGSGAGYSKAVTVSNLTMSDVSASTVADLYPGGTGDVKFSVTNPNSFAVTITGIAANGAATSDDVACTTTGVSFTTTTGLTQVVGAGATVAFTLAGKAAMSNASLNACQGDTFTLPVTLTATT